MQSSKRRSQIPVHVLVFLAPAVLLYTLFMVIPLINSLRLSFFQIVNQNQQSFAGLQNYVKLFTDSNFAPFFWRALRNNFVFFAVHMLVQNPIGLLLAALLAEGGRTRNFFRTVIFMPTVLSVVIIGFVWQLILNPLWGVAESIEVSYERENPNDANRGQNQRKFYAPERIPGCCTINTRGFC